MTHCGDCNGRKVKVYRSRFDGKGTRGIVACDCVPANLAKTIVKWVSSRQHKNRTR